MRTLSFVMIITLFVGCTSTPKKELTDSTPAEITSEPIFDSIKAYNFGADEYGMKQYVMAFLKKGPNGDLDSAGAFNLQVGHMENIRKMVDAGQLVLAGPFMGDGEIRGIYIFNVTTVEEAKELTETDPAIKAGSLVMDLLPWYGSAALMGINDEHKRVAKTLF